MVYNRRLVQLASAEERFCYGCNKKSSMTRLEQGKGYWIQKCRRCGSLKYWWDMSIYPEGISDMVNKYKNEN